MTEPLAVGLIGAGPWASMVHAPTIAAGPETRLVGVWARRPEAAVEVAGNNGTTAAASVDELFDRCEAVAFAVPPNVQAELGIRAARAGKALFLEKPIGADVASAQRLVDAIDEAGVASQVLLSWRYTDATRDFLSDAADFGAIGGVGRFLSPGLLGGMFATPWRLERGALLDLGPHVFDLLDAALGPVVDLQASGRLDRWISVALEHDSGVTSTAIMSGHIAPDHFRSDVELFSTDGVLGVDLAAAVGPDAFATARREFVEHVRNGRTEHDLDAHRGLHLQRLIEQAEQQLLS
jgi:predicted dehydrogenase